jgi:DNA-binding XRE family transcriptional regulator
MKIDGLLTDEAILAELAGRLVQRRLELQLTQEMLAEQAGVSKRTVERVEAGTTTQMSTMIRILRVLELLDRLETLVPEAGPRKPADDVPWKWGDEA